MIKIIRKTAPEPVVALKEFREGVVSGQKMREPAGESRIGEQLVGVFTSLRLIGIRLCQFIEFTAAIFSFGRDRNHLIVKLFPHLTIITIQIVQDSVPPSEH